MTRNIVVISPVPSHPPSAGNRARVNEMTRALVEMGHDVYFVHALLERGDTSRMREVWGQRYIPVPCERRLSPLRHRWRQVARRIGAYGAYNYGIDEWYDPALDREVRRITSEVQVDTVVVEYVFLSRALLAFPAGTLKVLDAHDEFANRHRRYLREGQRPVWYSCTPRSEHRGLSRADVVLAIQDQEAERFRRHVDARVEVVGHLAPLRPLAPDRVVPKRILVVGSSNPINVRSLVWFVQEVLPRIQAAEPRCELVAAGSICREIGGLCGVRCLGELEDLSSAYAEAQVVVNPTRFGTGLKIKSLEALSFARPLVTTSAGAAGMDAGDGCAFRVADEPTAIAAAVCDLLESPTRAAAMGRAGFEFARANNQRVRRSLEAVFGRASRQEGMV